MVTFHRNDIKICLNFQEASELLTNHFGENGNEFSPYYDARIIYNKREPNHIDLIIYYKQSEFLLEKFQKLTEERFNILSGISTQPAQQVWEHPDILDFTNSKLLNIEESHHWEHDRKPLILKIDNLDILINSRYVGDGNFQLTENVNQHIYEYYNYGGLGNYSPLDKFIESDNNKEMSFGNIQIKLSFRHDYGDSTKFSFTINRDAYLNISDNSEKLSDIQILEHGEILCVLMSFYWQKSIDYFIAAIRVNNVENYRTREVYKYSNHQIDESENYSLKIKYATVYEFLETLNYQNVLNHKNLLIEIVPKLIKTKSVDDTSGFMLLYNILEKIRNYCISKPIEGTNLDIKEEFKFSLSKSATVKYIKGKIKEIVDIVDSEDKEEFLQKANQKVTFIKKTGLTDQFDSLVSYLQLDPSAYNLDFIQLIKIRNNLYHGSESQEDVKPYNNKMIDLINDLLLRMIQ